jgi:hypothetical protein
MEGLQPVSSPYRDFAQPGVFVRFHCARFDILVGTVVNSKLTAK